MNLGCRTARHLLPVGPELRLGRAHPRARQPAPARRRHPAGHQPRQLHRRPAAGGRGPVGDPRDQRPNAARPGSSSCWPSSPPGRLGPRPQQQRPVAAPRGQRLVSLAVAFDLKHVDPTEAQVAPFPFLYMTGFRDPQFSDEEVDACGGTCRRAASCSSTTAPATTPSTSMSAPWSASCSPTRS